MNDLENVETFVSVATHLSFVKAANAMNLRQPSITARIKRLEDRLGVQLFVRNKNHRVHLTEEGRVFLPLAQQMIRLMQEAENNVRNVKHVFEGKIRIGVTPSWTVDALPRILGMVQERYPRIGFYVINGTTRSIYNMVLDNQVDIGLVSYDIMNQQIERLYVHDTPWVLVCSPNHRLAGKKEVDIQDILNEPLVTYEQSTEGWRKIQRTYGSYNTVPNVTAQLEQLEAAKAMVSYSSCISLLPLICVHNELEDGRLVGVKVRQLSDVSTRMTVIFLKAKSSYLMVRMMQQMIMEYFRSIDYKNRKTANMDTS
ncbi:LysR family transcriptional regulator [Alicyclobacillus shizuokensis]|uniref:LysR family transcriptional regulator n=1 Tax=Alicyclobacillus shizuokensis TaxID=392014 RepID=UPI000830EBFF|nr:LysR family transcriptional regulator [Alicyclobacillus shizuokensis]